MLYSKDDYLALYIQGDLLLREQTSDSLAERLDNPVSYWKRSRHMHVDRKHAKRKYKIFICYTIHL